MARASKSSQVCGGKKPWLHSSLIAVGHLRGNVQQTRNVQRRSTFPRSSPRTRQVDMNPKGTSQGKGGSLGVGRVSRAPIPSASGGRNPSLDRTLRSHVYKNPLYEGNSNGVEPSRWTRQTERLRFEHKSRSSESDSPLSLTENMATQLSSHESQDLHHPSMFRRRRTVSHREDSTLTSRLFLDGTSSSTQKITGEHELVITPSIGREVADDANAIQSETVGA